jgi:pimeloyl-ACP methyl ester carboxylesterase
MTTPDPLQLSFIAEGEGLPVLLVHDLNASLNDWEALIPQLLITGHRIYACDLLAHGESPQPEDPRMYYAQMLFSTFRRWMDGLELELAPIMIGHGFGAYLCLRYAIGHPYKVNKLILLNPLFTPAQIDPLVMRFSHQERLAQLASRFAHEWTTRKMLGLPKEIDLKLLSRIMTDYRRASSFNVRIPSTVVDISLEMKKLPTRSLYLWGQADPLFNMNLLPPLMRDVMDVVLHPLPGLGHRPHLEAPKETNQVIVNFLLGISN